MRTEGMLKVAVLALFGKQEGDQRTQLKRGVCSKIYRLNLVPDVVHEQPRLTLVTGSFVSWGYQT